VYRVLSNQREWSSGWTVRGVQIKSKLCEKEPTMKPQCPKDNAVVELAFKPINRIAKVDVAAVDVVGNVTLKQRWQIMLQGRDRSLNPLQVVTPI